MNLNELWRSSDPKAWDEALKSYWDRIPDRRHDLEQRMEDLRLEKIEALDGPSWLAFLDDDYFPWKYTQGNRLATCRRWLRRQAANGGVDELNAIRQRLLAIEPAEIARPLLVVQRIKGLGVAGGSGLLSLMYPAHFCTLDQYLVRNLRSVRPNLEELNEMKPDQLTGLDGVFLTELVRGKALSLSAVLDTKWTPRMVDKVLWAIRPG